MDRDDRDRLIRIETILTDNVVPRLGDYGKRIKALERVAQFATVFWGILGVVGYVAKDATLTWIKQKSTP